MGTRGGVPIGAMLLVAVFSGCGSEQPTRTLKVYSSMPEHGIAEQLGRSTEEGAELALDEHDGKVGRVRIAYEKLDDTRGGDFAEASVGERNARRAAADPRAIAYLGDYNSGVSRVTLPILNRAGLAQVSSSNTYVGLTRDAAGADPGDPDRYYPTGRRTYVRIIPNDLTQAGALANMAKSDGCREIHVLAERTTYGQGLATNTLRAASKLGLGARASGFASRAASYAAPAARVRSPCAIVTGELPAGGRMLAALAEHAQKGLRVYGADGICTDAASDPSEGVPHSAATGYACAIATLDPPAFGRRGQRFVTAFERRFKHAPGPVAIYGYEAMSLLLDAVGRSQRDGHDVTRSAVVRELLTTRNRRSSLGSYSIDRYGDTTLTTFGRYKIVAARLELDRAVTGFSP